MIETQSDLGTCVGLSELAFVSYFRASSPWTLAGSSVSLLKRQKARAINLHRTHDDRRGRLWCEIKCHTFVDWRWLDANFRARTTGQHSAFSGEITLQVRAIRYIGLKFEQIHWLTLGNFVSQHSSFRSRCPVPFRHE